MANDKNWKCPFCGERYAAYIHTYKDMGVVWHMFIKHRKEFTRLEGDNFR